MDLKRVLAPEAKGLIDGEGYVLIDVRSAPEFAAEHAAGAYNIPFLHKQPYGMVANAEFAQVIAAVFPDKNTKLITTCGMGGRSMRAAAELIGLGYQQVLDLRGGFEGEKDESGRVLVPGWKSSDLPLEKGEPGDRSYGTLLGRAGVPAPSSPAPASPAPAHGHGHSHAAPEPAGKVNRFADPNRVVHCAKLDRDLPALKRRPMGGPLGERLFQSISAEAWEQWVEHSKLIINEYRLNPAEAKSQELLVKQCEEFLFGQGAAVPKEFVPEKS